MNWDDIAFDWNQVRAFLAASEEGSLSAAARALQQTQPTLSRQVSNLEQTLGVTLFERNPRGLNLTVEGKRLLVKAEDAELAVVQAQRAVSGLSEPVNIFSAFSSSADITKPQHFSSKYFAAMVVEACARCAVPKASLT